MDGQIIRMYLVLKEQVWKAADWIHLAQDRDKLKAVVQTEMELRIT